MSRRLSAAAAADFARRILSPGGPGRKRLLTRCRSRRKIARSWSAYCARLPFAFERLELFNEEWIAYRPPKCRRDRASSFTFTPLALVDRLVALIPASRLNRCRNHGALAPRVPLPPPTGVILPCAGVPIQSLKSSHGPQPQRPAHAPESPRSSTSSSPSRSASSCAAGLSRALCRMSSRRAICPPCVAVSLTSHATTRLPPAPTNLPAFPGDPRARS